MSLLQQVVTFTPSTFPPLAVGFFGLGTGYLIYGPQELLGYPRRSANVDFGTGMWGFWMPGFMQFFAGVFLFAGLDLFGTFTKGPLYMAALAFTAFGVHWFALGWNRLRQADPRVNVGMCVPFLLISLLGAVTFFKASDLPVGGVFIGLACVYATEFFASMKPDQPRIGGLAERVLGFVRIGTGLWLMYLTWAVVLNFVLKYTLPE